MTCNGDCNQGRECICDLDAKRIAELEAERDESNSTVAMKAYRHTKAKLAIAIEALELIDKVNAMDYEYVRWAREALTKIKGE